MHPHYWTWEDRIAERKNIHPKKWIQNAWREHRFAQSFSGSFGIRVLVPSESWTSGAEYFRVGPLGMVMIIALLPIPSLEYYYDYDYYDY